MPDENNLIKNKFQLIKGDQWTKTLTHKAGITDLTFSPDGKFLLASDNVKSAMLWDINKGKIVRRLKGHKSSIIAVAITPDNRFYLTGSDDGMLNVWHSATGELVHTYQNHTGNIYEIVPLSDCKRILSAGLSFRGPRDLQLWEVETGNVIHCFNNYSGTTVSLAISSDDRFAVSGGFNKMSIWEIDSGNELFNRTESWLRIEAIAVSADNRFIATGKAPSGIPDTVHLLNLSDGQIISNLGHLFYCRELTFSPNSKYLIAVGSGRLQIWDVETYQTVYQLDEPSNINTVAISLDGTFLAYGMDNGEIKIQTLPFICG